MPQVRAQFEALMLEPLLQPFAQLLAREFAHERS